MQVSIILPTYNEARNIVELITAIGAHVPAPWDYEVIVVDDDSPDGTYALVRRTFADDPHVRAILRTTDKGLAKSIRTGIDSARGQQIIVMDTDFTHSPQEIPRLLHVAQIYDIVSGSRFCAGGQMQDTHHYLSSLMFNWFARLILRTQIQDNTGGFFTMRTEKLKQLPLDRIFFGYGDYFFRLLHHCQRRRFTIVEIPARYIDRSEGESKSSFLKMFFSYTRALFKVRITAWRSED
jgi:dolichol-phosphate mannosyltransferase